MERQQLVSKNTKMAKEKQADTNRIALSEKKANKKYNKDIDLLSKQPWNRHRRQFRRRPQTFLFRPLSDNFRPTINQQAKTRQWQKPSPRRCRCELTPAGRS